MSLQPNLRPMIVVGDLDAPHTLECFMDYVCSYSTSLGTAIEEILKPLFDPKGRGAYAGQVKIIFRNQVQPWHGQSTFMHETSLAVVRVAPEKFWEFSLALWKRHREFIDLNTSSMTPDQTRDKLIDLAVGVVGSDKRKELKELLTVKEEKANYGVAVTEDLKYTVRFSRQNSIHASPTVLWDGVVAPEVSSKWGKDDWAKWLEKKLGPPAGK